MDTSILTASYTVQSTSPYSSGDAPRRAAETQTIRSGRAEFIPAYPDDADLSYQKQRQSQLNDSQKETRGFIEVEQMTGDDQSLGRFLDVYA